MSGIEILGLVSGIITLIDACLKIYDGAKEAPGLPSVLQDSARRLPLIRQALLAAREGVKQEEWPHETGISLLSMLSSCEDKVRQMLGILQAFMPPQSSRRRMNRWLRALKMVSKFERVGALMDAIIVDLQVLSFSYAIKGTTRAHISRLIGPVADVENKEKNSSQAQSMLFYNTGPGSQFIHSGSGDIGVSTGTGPGFSGNIKTFNFNFP